MTAPLVPWIQENTCRLNPTYFSKLYPEFYTYLSQTYPDIKLAEALYRHFFGQTFCKTCGSPTKFLGFSQGYAQYCCSKCAAQNKETIAKRCATNLGRYGTEHAMQNKEIQEKMFSTNMAKYGTKSSAQSRAVKDKSKQTCIERFGCIAPTQNDLIHQKVLETNRERYGVDWAMQNVEIKSKAIAKQVELYGGLGMGSPEVSQKIQETNKKKYGYAYSTMCPDIIASRGDRLCLNNHQDLLYRTQDGEWVCKCPHPECNGCTDKCYTTHSMIQQQREKNHSETCTVLNPIGSNISSCELWLENILAANNIKYIKNDRTVLSGKELDFYLPDFNIAFEINGIYWHRTNIYSKISKPSNYHRDKTRSCEALGIQLIHIWEDWYHTRQDIIESIILNKLGLSKQKIYARSCIIDTNPKEYKQFLNENHIQGYASAKYYYGLRYNGELVALMSFGTRGGVVGNNECELIRYCCKKYTNVIGAPSKLFKAFIKEHQPASIISYASHDISNGHLYDMLGFKCIGESKSYWYIDLQYNRYHRGKFTKAKIIKMGLTDDTNQTEFEIMDKTQYMRIYDSGQLKYKWLMNASVS